MREGQHGEVAKLVGLRSTQGRRRLFHCRSHCAATVIRAVGVILAEAFRHGPGCRGVAFELPIACISPRIHDCNFRG